MQNRGKIEQRAIEIAKREVIKTRTHSYCPTVHKNNDGKPVVAMQVEKMKYVACVINAVSEVPMNGAKMRPTLQLADADLADVAYQNRANWTKVADGFEIYEELHDASSTSSELVRRVEERQKGAEHYAAMEKASMLDAAGALNSEYEKFRGLEKQTVESALKLGVGLLQAKQELPHGQFGAFMRDHITFSERHAQRFMKLATTFLNSLPENQRGMLLAGGNVDEAAAEFIDGKNQMELFTEFGITSPKKPVRKLAPAALPKGETPEHFAAKHTWTEIGAMINVNGLEEESWAHLTDHERTSLYELVHELDKRLKTSLANGNKVSQAGKGGA